MGGVVDCGLCFSLSGEVCSECVDMSENLSRSLLIKGVRVLSKFRDDVQCFSVFFHKSC